MVSFKDRSDYPPEFQDLVSRGVLTTATPTEPSPSITTANGREFQDVKQSDGSIVVEYRLRSLSFVTGFQNISGSEENQPAVTEDGRNHIEPPSRSLRAPHSPVNLSEEDGELDVDKELVDESQDGDTTPTSSSSSEHFVNVSEVKPDSEENTVDAVEENPVVELQNSEAPLASPNQVKHHVKGYEQLDATERSLIEESQNIQDTESTSSSSSWSDDYINPLKKEVESKSAKENLVSELQDVQTHSIFSQSEDSSEAEELSPASDQDMVAVVEAMSFNKLNPTEIFTSWVDVNPNNASEDSLSSKQENISVNEGRSVNKRNPIEEITSLASPTEDFGNVSEIDPTREDDNIEARLVKRCSKRLRYAPREFDEDHTVDSDTYRINFV